MTTKGKPSFTEQGERGEKFKDPAPFGEED